MMTTLRDAARSFGRSIRSTFIKDERDGRFSIVIPGWVVFGWAVFCWAVGFEFGIGVLAILLWITMGITLLLLAITMVLLVSTPLPSVSVTNRITPKGLLDVLLMVPVLVILYLSGWTTIVWVTMVVVALTVSTMMLARMKIREEREREEIIRRERERRGEVD